MSSFAPGPPETPTLEEILRELEQRYRGMGEPRTYPLPPPPAAPAVALPEEDKSALLSALGTAMSIPGYPFRELAAEVYKRQFPGVPEERIPDVGTMLQQVVLPEQAAEERTFGGEAARAATRAAGGMLVDPVSTGLILGGAGLAPPALRGALHLGLAGMMGHGMYQRGKEYLAKGAEFGYTSPEAGAPAGEFALDAALLGTPLATRLAARRIARK
mgnify:CR=1 FL=1